MASLTPTATSAQASTGHVSLGARPSSRLAPPLSRLTASAASPSSASPTAAWAGETLLSRAVNAAIAFPPTFAVLKVLGKREMQGSAGKVGISWEGHVRALEARLPELEAVKQEVEDPDMTYPDYFLVEFHAYETGNMNWLAAMEVEPATHVMHWRTWKDPELSPHAAGLRLRGAITAAIDDFRAGVGAPPVNDLLDVGCSVGFSSRCLAEHYSAAQVTGLDLCPYYLAVAELEERETDGPSGRKRIQYTHRNAEATGLPDDSYDLITMCFMFHECPEQVMRNVLEECRRLVRPGGVVAFVDTNPASKVLCALPTPLFTLMKSTEPWTDEYFTFDHEAAALEAGFSSVKTVESDHRHKTVMMHAGST